MNELDLDKIGKFIQSLRNKRKMSQNDLAKEVGVTFKAISKWENGGSFPDVLYQRKLCNALGITLDELQDGELNIKKRKQERNSIIFKRVAITLFCILIPLLIFLGIYFCMHVNSYHEYRLESDKDNYSCYIEGFIFELYSEKTLLINSIKIKDYNVQNNDIINVDLYSNDKIIYHTNIIESFYINLSKNIDINNLKMIISIIDKNGIEHLYNTSFIIRTTSLNKVEKVKDTISSQNDDKIIENLKKNNFIKTKTYTWQKIEKIKSKEIQIDIYLMDHNKKIMFSEITNEIIKNIFYGEETKSLDVYIYHKDNEIHTLIEKYSYNYLTKENNCQVGICSTLDEVLKLMEKYINLLTVE